jgi:hypothetical protein
MFFYVSMSKMQKLTFFCTMWMFVWLPLANAVANDPSIKMATVGFYQGGTFIGNDTDGVPETFSYQDIEVKAHFVSSQPGVELSKLKPWLTVYDNQNNSENLDFYAPDGMRNIPTFYDDTTKSLSATIPANWVKPGLRWNINWLHYGGSGDVVEAHLRRKFTLEDGALSCTTLIDRLDIENELFYSMRSSCVSAETLRVSDAGDNSMGLSVAHSDDISIDASVAPGEFSDNDFAMSFWFKPEVLDSGEFRQLTRKGAWSNFDLSLSGNKLSYELTDRNGQIFQNSLTSLRLGKWHHIAYVKEGTFIKLYIDGELDHQQQVNGVRVSDEPFFIGDSDTRLSGVGDYADMEVCKNALTGEQVQSIYQHKLYSQPGSIGNNGFVIEADHDNGNIYSSHELNFSNLSQQNSDLGYYANDQLFPGLISSSSNFAIRASAIFYLAEGGIYTFGAHYTDGVDVTIDGDVLITDVSSDFFSLGEQVSTVELNEGFHTISVVYYADSPTPEDKELELYWALGEHESFDEQTFALFRPAEIQQVPLINSTNVLAYLDTLANSDDDRDYDGLLDREEPGVCALNANKNCSLINQQFSSIRTIIETAAGVGTIDASQFDRLQEHFTLDTESPVACEVLLYTMWNSLGVEGQPSQDVKDQVYELCTDADGDGVENDLDPYPLLAFDVCTSNGAAYGESCSLISYEKVKSIYEYVVPEALTTQNMTEILGINIWNHYEDFILPIYNEQGLKNTNAKSCVDVLEEVVTANKPGESVEDYYSVCGLDNSDRLVEVYTQLCPNGLEGCKLNKKYAQFISTKSFDVEYIAPADDDLVWTDDQGDPSKPSFWNRVENKVRNRWVRALFGFDNDYAMVQAECLDSLPTTFGLTAQGNVENKFCFTDNGDGTTAANYVFELPTYQNDELYGSLIDDNKFSDEKVNYIDLLKSNEIVNDASLNPTLEEVHRFTASMLSYKGPKVAVQFTCADLGFDNEVDGCVDTRSANDIYDVALFPSVREHFVLVRPDFNFIETVEGLHDENGNEILAPSTNFPSLLGQFPWCFEDREQSENAANNEYGLHSSYDVAKEVPRRDFIKTCEHYYSLETSDVPDPIIPSDTGNLYADAVSLSPLFEFFEINDLGFAPNLCDIKLDRDNLFKYINGEINEYTLPNSYLNGEMVCGHSNEKIQEFASVLQVDDQTKDALSAVGMEVAISIGTMGAGAAAQAIPKVARYANALKLSMRAINAAGIGTETAIATMAVANAAVQVSNCKDLATYDERDECLTDFEMNLIFALVGAGFSLDDVGELMSSFIRHVAPNDLVSDALTYTKPHDLKPRDFAAKVADVRDLVGVATGTITKHHDFWIGNGFNLPSILENMPLDGMSTSLNRELYNIPATLSLNSHFVDDLKTRIGEFDSLDNATKIAKFDGLESYIKNWSEIAEQLGPETMAAIKKMSDDDYYDLFKSVVNDPNITIDEKVSQLEEVVAISRRINRASLLNTCPIP